MKYKYRVNTIKYIFSLISLATFMIIGICLLTINRYGSALIFLFLGICFIVPAIMNGSNIYVTSHGIRQAYLGITLHSLKWEDISEIGVIGTKVFNKNHPERTGTLYIYFSKTTLTQEDRFNLILKWPPLKKPHLRYTDTRLEKIQFFWNSLIVTFNTGELRL